MEEIRNLILQEYSKSHSDFIADVLRQNQHLLPEFIEIVYLEEEPISRRAAWSLRLLFDASPKSLDIYIDDFISHLDQLSVAPILRGLLAIISKIDIDEKWHAYLIQYTSEAILSNKSEIAIKAFSMDIFFQIAKKEPDLFYELEQMIEYIYPESSRGIQNKCRNMTKWIEKRRAKN